jgi:hypothetical protein
MPFNHYSGCNTLVSPTGNAHNDYSAAGAGQRLIDILGDDRACEFRAGHYAFVNVWRPIEQLIRTSPRKSIESRALVRY